MTASLQLQALDIFTAWLDWPAEGRAERLAAELADRPELRAEVERLIRADAGAAILPTQPPEPVDLNAAIDPPERVGVYRLIEQIGRGGMGLVFRAERDDGLFAQTVAVKLIRRSLFAGQAAAQFASERQILARLRHPHIAQLFDGGVTADGESYIVMELIDGEAITTHSAANALSLRQRIALMGDVCDAVQFAHQQFIVHADITPGNVVVDTRYGVKLLDFGIARMVNAAEPDEARPRGRTAYASPQQLAGEPPTPSDDIYALGHLLDVLAGADAKAGSARAADELRAVIARATAADPAERYATAADLGADLARWRDGRPVRALPQSRQRNVRMFVERHWLGVGLSALALFGLIAATAISSLLYVRADAARRESEQRFAETRVLSGYLLEELTDTLQRFPGTSRLRHDLALKGRSYLETLSHVPGAPLDMQLEIASGYAKTGAILGQPSLQSLGDPALARRDLTVAEARLRQLMISTHQRSDVALALAGALATDGSISHVTDNNAVRASALFRESCALAGSVAAREPQNRAARMAQVRCLIGQLNVHDYEGRFAEMKAPLDQVFATLGQVREQPNDVDYNLALGNAYILLGDKLYYGGPREASTAAYQKAVEVLDRASARIHDVRLLGRLAWADSNYSDTLIEHGRGATALAVVEQGVAAADRVLFFEKSPRAHHNADSLHLQRAVILSSLKRHDEAIAQGDAAIAGARATAAAFPADFEAARSVPIDMRGLAEIYRAAGRNAEACALLIQTRDAWSTLARNRRMTGFDAADETKVVTGLLEKCPAQAPDARSKLAGRPGPAEKGRSANGH